MEKKDKIFQVIRENYDSHKLPFDKADWNDMLKTLDKEEQKSRGWVIVIKRFGIPLGIASGLIFAMTLFFNLNDTNNSQPYVKEDISSKLPPNHAEITPIDSMPGTALRTKVMDRSISQRIHNSKEVKKYDTGMIADTKRDGGKVLYDSATKVIRPREESILVKEPKQLKDISPGYFPPVDIDMRKNIQLAAAGGINYNSQKVGYSFGLNLSKNLTSKFFIQMDIGLNRNSRDASYAEQNVTITAEVHPGIGGPDTIYRYDTSMMSYTRVLRQNYGQATLSVGLKTFGNNNINLGVDLQRLMISKEELNVINANRDNTLPITMWNAGALLQYRHYLSKALSVGVAYRQDITGMLNNTYQNNTFRFNIHYILLK